MAYKYRRMAVLAKIETVYNTDPVPTGAANAMLMVDVTIEPLNATEVDRNLSLPAAGLDPIMLAGHWARISGKTELVGSGTAGTAPAWGPLLRCEGWSETIVAATSVTYAPVSDNEDSATLYFYADGALHKLTGARGKTGIEFTKLGIPYLTHDITGIYQPVAAGVMPALTLTAWKKPKALNKDNTPTAQLHALDVKMPALSIDFGQSVELRDYANQREVVITNRAPSGSITVEAVAPGTKNWAEIIRAETTGALNIVHGVGAGSVITLNAPYAQLSQLRRVNDNGVAMHQMALRPTRLVGDDEFTIVNT